MSGLRASQSSTSDGRYGSSWLALPPTTTDAPVLVVLVFLVPGLAPNPALAADSIPVFRRRDVRRRDVRRHAGASGNRGNRRQFTIVLAVNHDLSETETPMEPERPLAARPDATARDESPIDNTLDVAICGIVVRIDRYTATGRDRMRGPLMAFLEGSDQPAP